jgi:hypothetical protein
MRSACQSQERHQAEPESSVPEAWNPGVHVGARIRQVETVFKVIAVENVRCRETSEDASRTRSRNLEQIESGEVCLLPGDEHILVSFAT